MPSVFFKPIRPRRMKEDAIRLALLTALHKVAREVTADYKKTTRTWNHQPEFTTMISLRDGPSFLVGTDDELYRLINDGAKPHVILPKNKKLLSYKGKFKSKTIPGRIYSRQGGKSGKYVHRRGVMHPGHEARNFEKTIYEKWLKKFKSRMIAALKEGVEKSGHAAS